MLLALGLPRGLPLVVQLRIDELEHFLEGIAAGVGEEQVFDLQHDVLQTRALLDQNVLALKVVERPRLFEQVGEGLIRVREVGQVVEEVGVLPVPNNDGTAVGPYSNRSTRRVAVRLQLFEPVLALWLLALNDDVGRRRRTLLEDDDVGGLVVDRRAKLNRLLQGDAVLGIAVLAHQLVQVELPDDLFGLGWAGFVAHGAGEVGFAALVEDCDRLQVGIGKHLQAVLRTFENVGDGREGCRGCLIFFQADTSLSRDTIRAANNV